MNVAGQPVALFTGCGIARGLRQQLVVAPPTGRRPSDDEAQEEQLDELGVAAEV